MDQNLEASYYRSSILKDCNEEELQPSFDDSCRALWGTKTDSSPFGGYPPRNRLAGPWWLRPFSRFRSRLHLDRWHTGPMTKSIENPPTDVDDQRAKFKAALEAKKNKPGHAGSHPDAAGGPVKDHSGRSGGKREFRRKSGG